MTLLIKQLLTQGGYPMFVGYPPVVILLNFPTSLKA